MKGEKYIEESGRGREDEKKYCGWEMIRALEEERKADMSEIDRSEDGRQVESRLDTHN